MTPAFKRCPVCGSLTFYIETPTGLVFFKVTSEGRAISTRDLEADLPGLDLSDICCTSCSFRGSLAELKD